ncbi:probable LRR receptor-like serine/threonine-protein kinase IRK [Prosopis cineraria]|uniref:probable LRR receptor-like serine/threonine-protein kinase IRK n=1 Tax=Prosopis cineraria TaxID=364024 RepID=UPI002410A8F5|nr:probable LRR receptor-like serine/threonine-protein kinase IRK [Prosopis cineraria]
MMQFTFFLLFLFAPIVVLSDAAAFNDDVLALVVFKAGLQDPKAKLSTWNEDDDNPCKWVGVKCDPTTSRVSAIVLDGFSLSGHIDRGLLRLQSLQVLSLSKNNFSGSINPDLLRLGSLEVVNFSENNLSGSISEGFFQQCGSLRSVSFAKNNLTGKIPDSLSSCSLLVAVNFSSNQLNGNLPSGIWFLRQLQSLDLSNNLLEGEIPEGIENLNDLKELNLQRNRFIGRLPDDIGGCMLLKSLDFSDNFLSGAIPESTQGLNSCTSLNLRGNSFTGAIPDWIRELKNLEMLDISANRFSGWIPKSIGNLNLLTKLNLSRNHFTGNLPESMVNCVKLLALDVSQNQLEGPLPSWIFKTGLQSISPSGNRFNSSDYPSFTSIPESYHGLQVLDLSSNAFSGKLPSNLGGLSSLQVLNMSANNISGSIPAGIGELKSLYILDLSDNKLNGRIPPELEGTSSLSELRLQNNSLSGEIPAQIEKCSSLTTLILSHNKLTSSIPAAMANLTNLKYVDLSWNKLSGSLPKNLSNLSHLLFFNVSYNHLQGELPVGGFFNIISPSSVAGNPSLCGSVVNHSCPSVHPKPIVLNTNSSYSNSNSNSNASSLNHGHKKIILSISSLIAIGAAAFITIGVVAITVLNIHVRHSMSHSAAPFAFSGAQDYSCSPANDPNYGKLVMFSGEAGFDDGANKLLNKDSIIGRGGFGTVYHTVLRDGHSVAIKKLTVSGLIKSQEDFEREVKTHATIKHQNLVGLKGYYWTSSLQLLIYEYLSRGSLHKLLHEEDEHNRNLLSWRQRFKIILGMARGLAHLHQMNIIHYNLKSTNVLIDCSGEPKIGDFGLVRLLPVLDHCVLSSKIQSALGYMAPEFACRTVKITEKCDVYGFGILVLEVVTGKRPVEYMEDDVVVLCDMVRGMLEEGRVEQCVDRRLLGNFVAEEAIPVIKLGLICASQVPSNRPDMAEAVNILELIQCPSEGQEELA